MPYVLRPYRRFPVLCDVLYEHWLHVGQGIVWNLSTTGWRVSGTLPLQCGDVCSLRVVLPTRNGVAVSAGIVRWARGEDFGIETLVMDSEAQARLDQYIRERMKAV